MHGVVITMIIILLCYSNPLRVELGDTLEFACNNFSNLFIQVNKSNHVCVFSTNLTELILLYRLIKFSTIAAMQVLVLEYMHTMANAIQAVQL